MDLGSGPGLAAEAQAEHPLHLRIVSRAGDHLHRHRPLQLAVHRVIHRPHPAHGDHLAHEVPAAE